MSEDSSSIALSHSRLRMISDVTRRFAEATTDYQALLQSVADGLASVVGESCVVMLLSEDGAELRTVATAAPEGKVRDLLANVFAGRPIVLSQRARLAEVLARGEPLAQHFGPGEPASEEQRRWQQLGLHSVLIAPLRLSGRSIGAVTMGRFRPDLPPFSEEERDLAHNLANHASLAIENARLYAAARAAVTAADTSERRLQRTLDLMQEGYTIMSRDLRYLYVNEAGARHTRLSKAQLLERTPMELYPGFEGGRVHRALLRALEGSPQRVEEELQLSEGVKAFFELNIQPVPEGLVVLSVDATERRAAELRRDSLAEQLRQAQKMEAVGRLAGGVAHDFNNLLSVILGYGEEMLSSLEAGHPLRPNLEEIHKASASAAELTRRLLTFSRQQVLEPRVLELNEVIGSLQRMLERVLGEGTTLSLLLEPALGRVRADRGSLEQVCLNLVVNARDAMPYGGKLTIETTNVELDEAFVREHLGTSPGPYVLMAVSDTGVGMDRATRARAFEPFFTTKEQGKGTGLGLSTVFGIVQQSGGGIWVYSEPAKGSTFKIFLPRVEAALEGARPSRQPRAVGGSETLLLMEDDERVRAVARRILERHGYRVLAPADVHDALRLGSQDDGQIALLITDVVMPGLSGAELASRMLQLIPALKVLYVSGYTDGSINLRGLVQEGASFLQKPFTSELLASKVRSVLDGSP